MKLKNTYDLQNSEYFLPWVSITLSRPSVSATCLTFKPPPAARGIEHNMNPTLPNIERNGLCPNHYYVRFTVRLTCYCCPLLWHLDQWEFAMADPYGQSPIKKSNLISLNLLNPRPVTRTPTNSKLKKCQLEMWNLRLRQFFSI